MLVSEALQVAIEVGLVVLCTFAFFGARSRGLIKSSTVCGAACVWILATVLLALLLPGHSRLLDLLIPAAFVGLLITPVAAAPLAFSINRHR